MNSSSMRRRSGFFRVTRPLLLPMVRTRWGRSVNVSSDAAIYITGQVIGVNGGLY